MTFFHHIPNIFKILFHFSILNYLARPRSHQRGYNVFGYFSKIVGAGQDARGFADELIRNGDEFVLVDFYQKTHKHIARSEENPYRKYYFRKFIYHTNIFFIDPAQWQKVRKKIPTLFLKNKHNIITFWWEFESGFEDRIPILNEFNEVYVFSDFIWNILNSVDNRNFKITRIKYPFAKNWIIEHDPLTVKRKYNLEGKFCFFFNFDYLSSYNRKNPEAILCAIAEEFPDEAGVVLIVKTNNSNRFEEKEHNFLNKIKNLGLNGRVVVINDPLSRNGFMTLLNAMDCYISLHRGEGLGLGILEALALNKPVIATNYGGNSEYMNNPLAMAVPYSMIPANDDYEPYKNVKFWAEPDISAAKKFMRTVFNEKMLIAHD